MPRYVLPFTGRTVKASGSILNQIQETESCRIFSRAGNPTTRIAAPWPPLAPTRLVNGARGAFTTMPADGRMRAPDSRPLSVRLTRRLEGGGGRALACKHLRRQHPKVVFTSASQPTSQLCGKASGFQGVLLSGLCCCQKQNKTKEQRLDVIQASWLDSDVSGMLCCLSVPMRLDGQAATGPLYVS